MRGKRKISHKFTIFNSKLNKIYFWWVFLIVYALFLFYTSSRALPDDLPLPAHPLTDKAIHFGEYFLLVLLAFKALGSNSRFTFLVAIGISLIYAGFNEAYQTYVPERAPSLYDLGADSAGIFLGAFIRHRIRSLLGPS